MSTQEPADTAFVGGGVYAVDDSRPWAQAAAVRGGTIVAVGDDSDVRDLIEADTRVVDLHGKFLVPGFQDSHIHAPSGGLDRLRLDLSARNTMQGYREEIASYARTNPDAEWVLGGGWSFSLLGRPPTRRELDEVVPDRPAFITDVTNHTGWANSRAFEVAAVDASTVDPADGRIVRDDAGRPDGMLREGAIDLVRRHAPSTSAEMRLQGLLAAQSYLHSLGVTAWQDAIVGTYSTIEDNFDCYVAAAADGSLTARVEGALWFDRTRGLEQVPLLRERREATRNGRFRARTIKIMVDGGSENRSAAMIDPYRSVDGSPTDNTGIAFFEPAELVDIVAALDADGFDLHVHAIGDRACRMALDAFEQALTGDREDRRHHMAHLHVVQPADVPRLGKLGIIANAQPLWATHCPEMDVSAIPFLGPERAAWQYRFASFARGGARLAFGSDWPVSSPNVLWRIHVAVNRTPPAGLMSHLDMDPVEPLLPDEGIDLHAAVHASTMGTAFLNRLDQLTGSIEVGKLADLVVLDRNIFERPTEEIGDAEVLLTLVDGTPVYESPTL